MEKNIKDMSSLSPSEMANRLVLNHYLILNSSIKNDSRSLHLLHGEIAKKHAQLTVQEIVAVYSEDEWEVKSYWDLVSTEIDKLNDYPYCNVAIEKQLEPTPLTP